MPPASGTFSSALPWMCMTATGCAGAQPLITTEPAAVDRMIARDLRDDGAQERDVVDAMRRGIAAARAGVPGEEARLAGEIHQRPGAVAAVRVGGDEALTVGLGAEPRLLRRAAAMAAAMQHDDQRRRRRA